MRTPAHFLRDLPLFITAALVVLAPVEAHAQCNACADLVIPGAPVKVDSVDTPESATIPASSGLGRFSLTISQSPTGTPLPVNLPAGVYPGWCGTRPTDISSQPTDFLATTNLGSANPPILPVMNLLNYIVNHKQGAIADVQEAIWTALGTRTVAYLQANRLDTALAMYTDAISHPNFTPAPGQRRIVVLLSNTPKVQNLLAEVVNCATIGDRVWLDSNGNGLQDSGEPGLNGVTVQLVNSAGQVVATTTTSPAPDNYPYALRINGNAVENGWYQFQVDCADTYTVRIDKTQAALAGTSLTAANAGDTTRDSNGVVSAVNPNYIEASVTPNLTVNPSINVAIDFGFKGTAPLNLTCPTDYGFVELYYNSTVAVTGGSTPYRFSVVGGALPPGLDLSSSGLLSGYPETAGTFSFTVQVTDAASRVKTITCTINIKPAPLLVTCPGVGDTTTVQGKVGVPYSQRFGVDGGAAPYTFEVTSGSLPPGLALDPSTGVVSGTPTAAGSFTFGYVIQDSTRTSTYTFASNCSITILPADLTIYCPTATTGTVGTAYTGFVTAQGGTEPYTFSIIGGSLPPGLSLDPSGKISGTPTQAGSFGFTVQVKDAAGTIRTVSCSITIGHKFQVTCPQGAGTTNVPYSSAASVTGGTGVFTFSVSGALPPGLTMSPATGLITGAPTAAGVFTFKVGVTDSSTTPSTYEESSCTMTTALTIACASNLTPIAGQPYSAAVTGVGGTAPYSFSNAVGLPAGLTMDANGVISGTAASVGTSSFTITVKDVAGNTGVGSCTLSVRNAPSASCVTINAVQGLPITPVKLTGTGGAGGPYTFAATGLPEGLGIAEDGSISGTPAASGTFQYTVTIKDSAGNTGTFTCSVTVNPPVSATCLTIAAVQGVPFTSAKMSATGGAGGPYTFSASGLPAGMSMASDGAISGTPGAAGTFSYTVTITDKDGHTGTASCSLTVSAPVAATCVSITAVQGASITPVKMSASGGVGGPYTFSASGLPAGLTMAPDGTISGTPTAGGAFSYTVTITDAAGNKGTADCSVIVNPPVSASCLAIAAVQGAAIAPVKMTATGGVGGPYTFSAVGLPAGVSMAGDGTISGAPTASGTFEYTVTVKDAAGNTGTLKCSLTVNPPVSATCATITAVRGIAIGAVKMIATGGTGGQYTFSADGLPSGLSMAPDGTISGTPAVDGAFTYTVTITDKDGHTGTANCSLTVYAPIASTCVSLAAVQGASTTPVTMTATGGVGGAYVFSAAGLPAGLTMAPNGTISGAPTVNGAFTYTVTVADSAGNKGAVECSVTVVAAPAVTCPAIAGLVRDIPMTPSAPLSATGGTGAPYTFSAVGLPDGLVMAPDGSISGTPAVNGAFSYTITVKDKDGHAGTASCSITVALPPAPTANCVAITAIQGAPITPVTMTASGGVGGPFTFSAAGLPAGISMSGDGTISGTPAVSGTFTYQVVIKDRTGRNQGTVNCTVVVAPPPSTACVAITAMQGVAILPVKLVATGGSGSGYKFSATGLPAGVTISLDGTISGTPTVSGSFPYTVTVTDGAGAVGSTTCSITVFAPIAAICPTITALQNTPIANTAITATGGSGSYTFSATGLPAGLSISGAGIISGAPVVSGVFNYTVTITDSKGFKGTLNCSMTVTAPVVCAPTVFDMTGGNSASTGTAGNIRSFTAPNGVKVNVSGWSRDKSTGAWAAAWLGSYSPGLGVTDTSEDGSDPSHRVDNVGSRVNYVLFEFNSPVIVNRAYLAAVGADSDIAVWVGNVSDAFTRHMTLSDSVLAALGAPEQNTTSSSSDRWADINGGNVSGNVLIIAASPSDFSKYDEFKIARLETQCNTTPAAPTATCPVITAVQGTKIADADMTPSGGAGGPYTFTATGLPAGLSMASDGTISGTPAVSGTFAYTVTVRDKNGNTGTVNCSVTVSPAPVCAPAAFDLTGGTASSGTSGNIRTFTATNGVKVKASAFARNKSTGAWTTAFLGSYSAGLGVTDRTEDGSDPTHRVDNAGQVNYVLFEFSQPVRIDRAYLDYIQGDSDIAVWIGTQNSPYTNHLTLSDALLAGLSVREENAATVSSGARWADFNAGYVEGNVLVIAARPSDSDDYFKISKLQTTCTTAPAAPAAACVSFTPVLGVPVASPAMTATGGAGAPYTFSAAGLPGGLTISSSGAISGTPTAVGSFNYTVTVKDKNGVAGTVNCSVTVTAPPPTVLCPAATGQAGIPYTSAIVASGGSGAYTYAVSGLPSGLSVNPSTGAITGTPAAAGSYSLVIIVTDGATGKASQINCSITIAKPVCGLSWGYWKNHVSAWPASALPMSLGAQSYTSSELQTLLAKAVAGDQSIELAHQLIAAKFNVANGTPEATANGAIAAADTLLAKYSGKLPCNVSNKAANGAQMVSLAGQLDTFNADGKGQPGCSASTGGCSGTIGNYVWVDLDADGVQETGEPGLPGVTVRLRDANSNLLQTTTTDSNGQYQFTGLCAGSYIVDVATPAGYTPTIVGAAAAGGDKDSSSSPVTVGLAANSSSNMSTDFGFVKSSCTGTIGDLVWKDTNGNGIQDAGEPGLPGVVLTLNWTLLGATQTAVTNSSGNYQFTGVCAGLYGLSVATPAGYTLTASGQGSDKSKDSNSNNSTILLTSNSSSDLTYDFGFKTQASTAGGYTTYTQGGWGSNPKGNNPGSVLYANFARVYPNGLSIGGNLKLTFTSPAAVQGFLPQGGTAGALTMSDNNPAGSAAGVFAGQVLALQLSADFSAAGITKTGLGNLKVTSGKFAGQTVAQVLATANAVLGGAALPANVSIGDLNATLDAINNNFDGGAANNGYCQ